MKEGALSKPVRQVITGIHLLNVTGIAISPSGMLFSTSAEGSVQQFQIGKCLVIWIEHPMYLNGGILSLRYVCSLPSTSPLGHQVSLGSLLTFSDPNAFTKPELQLFEDVLWSIMER